MGFPAGRTYDLESQLRRALRQAHRYIPSDVNSPLRALRTVGGHRGSLACENHCCGYGHRGPLHALRHPESVNESGNSIAHSLPPFRSPRAAATAASGTAVSGFGQPRQKGGTSII